MALQTMRQEYFQIPVVTRAYATACFLTTTAVQLDLVSPFHLYFNPTLIIHNFQLWRLFTTFLFFGSFGFNFFFNMIFTYRYCRMLEENHFRGRTSDFLIMLIFGAFFMILSAFYTQLLFLGQALTIMLVYVWARRNPLVRMNFFGLLNFQAPFLPWVLFIFSVLLGNTVVVDLLGMAVGHFYYFLEDIFPRQPGGFRILEAPTFLKRLLDEYESEIDVSGAYDVVADDDPAESPGGFNWTGRENHGEAQTSNSNQASTSGLNSTGRDRPVDQDGTETSNQPGSSYNR